MYRELDPEIAHLKPDDDTVIWKYMSFDKFSFLISQKELFFVRTDSNPIYLEGQFDTSDYENLVDNFAKDKAIEKPAENADKAIKIFEKHKSCTYIDCWHNNKNESFVMWKLFGGKNRNSIAIKSTVRKIKKVYDNKTESDCRIAAVEYYERNKPITLFNSHYMFMRKPLIFDYEKEIRGIIQWRSPYDFENYVPPKSENIKLESFEFIDKIILSPHSEEWFYQVVYDFLELHNVKTKLNESKYKY